MFSDCVPERCVLVRCLVWCFMQKANAQWKHYRVGVLLKTDLDNFYPYYRLGPFISWIYIQVCTVLPLGIISGNEGFVEASTLLTFVYSHRPWGAFLQRHRVIVGPKIRWVSAQLTVWALRQVDVNVLVLFLSRATSWSRGKSIESGWRIASGSMAPWWPKLDRLLRLVLLDNLAPDGGVSLLRLKKPRYLETVNETRCSCFACFLLAGRWSARTVQGIMLLNSFRFSDPYDFSPRWWIYPNRCSPGRYHGRSCHSDVEKLPVHMRPTTICQWNFAFYWTSPRQSLAWSC